MGRKKEIQTERDERDRERHCQKARAYSAIKIPRFFFLEMTIGLKI
jgi:hypothetical protein